MWTQGNQHKRKVERFRAKRGYPTDLSDQEWAQMEPLLPDTACTDLSAPHLTWRTGRDRRNVQLC